MQSRKIAVASLTLAGLGVCFGSPARAATESPAPMNSRPAYPPPSDPGQVPTPAGVYAQPPYPGPADTLQPAQVSPYPGPPAQAPPDRGPTYPAQPYQPQPAQPQPYYAPPPYPGQGGPQPGYNLLPQDSVRYVNRPRVGLIIGGAVTIGAAWGLSVLATEAFNICATVGASDGSTPYDYLNRPFGQACWGTDWPLYIPVVGPWIQMGFGPHDVNATTALAFDGLVQAGGLAMLIAGAVSHTRVAVYPQNGVKVTPLVLGSSSGVLVSGRF